MRVFKKCLTCGKEFVCTGHNPHLMGEDESNCFTHGSCDCLPCVVANNKPIDRWFIKLITQCYGNAPVIEIAVLEEL